MENKTKLTFPALFTKTLKNHEDAAAFAFVGENSITYKEVKEKIDEVIALLENLNIKSKDKVAILSLNMPNWGITYYAITFMGAIVVPILPDFMPTEIENVLTHSEAKAIFVSKNLYTKIAKLDNPKNVIKIEDFSIIESQNPIILSNKKSSNKYNINENDLATIIYTSGTTGKSKGVMLTHKNIIFNALAGKKIQPVVETDRFLSILPLSHTYENTLGLILPLLGGACVYYLKKPPTPSVLLPALQEVKPTVMLSVPLIIEKIHKNKIMATFNKSIATRFLYKIPPVRKLLNRIAGKKLYETFGGELKFFGIGGAKLNKTVEKFLLEAKFPYAIGYGLTETSPLLAGANPAKTKLGSTGPAVEGMKIKINDPDPKTREGEIWGKGPCVMQGYYKEPELTKQVITEDGWFKTGDLGVFDERGFLYIRGRLKNMIVGPSGENIYPEEIESVINNFKHVVESIVLQQAGKLVAKVRFNTEDIEKQYEHTKEDVSKFVEAQIEILKKELRKYVNSRVNAFSRIQKVIAQVEPFQKTATHKIKRFLHMK